MSQTLSVAQLAEIFTQAYLEKIGNQNVLQALSIQSLFEKETDGDELISKLDARCDSNDLLDPLREYWMDLAILVEIEKNQNDEGIPETPEWLAYEDRNIDRGTEMLNIWVYLKDCVFLETEPEIEDFLFDFLLVDEEDFQEEFLIYEVMVENIENVTASPAQLAKLRPEPNHELHDVFVPIMLFFGKNSLNSLRENPDITPIEYAILQLMRNFSKHFAPSA